MNNYTWIVHLTNYQPKNYIYLPISLVVYINGYIGNALANSGMRLLVILNIYP
jgi:hypothetical protein